MLYVNFPTPATRLSQIPTGECDLNNTDTCKAIPLDICRLVPEVPIVTARRRLYFASPLTPDNGRMMHRNSFVPTVLAFLFVLVAAVPAGAAEGEPRALVERFQGNLLAVMKEAETLGVKGRYERLVSPIEETFHLSLMIRVATGSFWKKATKAQRSGLLAAFKHMSVSTYANQFDGYSGQVFEIVGQRPGPQKTVLVKTTIVSPGDSPAKLTYVVKEFQGQWRIVDVLLDNDISQLAVRRSEYRGLLKNNGVDALIATLNTKADGLVAE